MNKKIVYPLLATSILTNLYLGYHHIYGAGDIFRKQTEYPLLSKRIFTQNPNDVLINFTPLRSALIEYIKPFDKKVGIYFEYLPSGSSIGINEKDQVKLASLSKIPLAMSVMKKVELKQMSLDDIVTLQPSDINNTYGNLWKAGPGTKLKVSELLKLSLAESDNTAYLALFRLLSKEEINGVYESLDIEINTESADGITYPIVSPKSYTSIFRSLYLASFVNQDSSSYILNILTNSIFKNTIEGGVPSNIDVAHKIGVFKKFDSKDDVYIDCGIVYVPYRPYILCVFVKNPDENVADQTIAFISKIIYDYISIVGK